MHYSNATPFQFMSFSDMHYCTSNNDLWSDGFIKFSKISESPLNGNGGYFPKSQFSKNFLCINDDTEVTYCSPVTCYLCNCCYELYLLCTIHTSYRLQHLLKAWILSRMHAFLTACLKHEKITRFFIFVLSIYKA